MQSKIISAATSDKIYRNYSRSSKHQLTNTFRLIHIGKGFFTDAFENFKHALAETTGINHRNPNWKLVVATDASAGQWGGVLYQVNQQLDVLEQLGFASGIFSGPDQKLSIRHRELLALTYSVRKFEYWLMGTVFVACVDHHFLVFLLKEKSKQKAKKIAESL